MAKSKSSFTLDEAKEHIRKTEEAKQKDREARLTEFNALITKAMEKTNCILQVDFTSPLSDIRIIAVSKE